MIEPKAFAKVNLFLDVLGRREDGFHELRTIMATVTEPWDQVAVGEAPDARVQLTVEPDACGVPADESNLVHRAARALREKAGLAERGVVMLLQKRIPAGGGLGGGSSDAAAVLQALDRLWGLELGIAGLAEIAAGLGSDVPFFLHGGVAECTGRGERVAPLPAPARPVWVVIHTPAGLAVPTPEVYRAFAEHGRAGQGGARVDRLRAALAAGDAGAIAADLYNALEAPAFALHPGLARVKARLAEAGLLGTLLSGSGASVFGIARDEAHADACVEALEGDLGVRPVVKASLAA